MKKGTKVSLLTGTMALGMATMLMAGAQAFHRHGTDILHFFAQESMTNAAVADGAWGKVSVRQNTQGRGNVQTLDISVRGLDTNGSYQLFAATIANPTLAAVDTFSSGPNGRASLHYRRVETNGKVHAVGHGKLALPAALISLSELRQVAVYDTNNLPIMVADLNTPDRLRYLVKKDISSTSVGGTLQIIANANNTQFRLLSAGLTPDADYLLVLNGGVVQTNTSNSKGRLAIKSILEPSLDVLTLNSVQLWDASSNVVLSTTLP